MLCVAGQSPACFMIRHTRNGPLEASPSLGEERIKARSSEKAKEVLHFSFTQLGNEERPSAWDQLLRR